MIKCCRVVLDYIRLPELDFFHRTRCFWKAPLLVHAWGIIHFLCHSTAPRVHVPQHTGCFPCWRTDTLVVSFSSPSQTVTTSTLTLFSCTKAKVSQGLKPGAEWLGLSAFESSPLLAIVRWLPSVVEPNTRLPRDCSGPFAATLHPGSGLSPSFQRFPIPKGTDIDPDSLKQRPRAEGGEEDGFSFGHKNIPKLTGDSAHHCDCTKNRIKICFVSSCLDIQLTHDIV